MPGTKKLSAARQLHLDRLNDCITDPSPRVSATLAETTNLPATRSAVQSISIIQSLTSRIAEKDSLLLEKENEALDLRNRLRQAQIENIKLETAFTKSSEEVTFYQEECNYANEEWTSALENVEKARKECTQARKEVVEVMSELKRVYKRVKRVENERNNWKESHSDAIESLDASNTEIISIQSQLDKLIAASEQKDDRLHESQHTITSLRKKTYALQKKVSRSKNSLSLVRAALNHLSNWSSMKNGCYTAPARKLYRDLKRTGCKDAAAAIKACADAFGVTVTKLMSRRTGERCVKELGQFGLIQLGREIMHADCRF